MFLPHLTLIGQYQLQVSYPSYVLNPSQSEDHIGKVSSFSHSNVANCHVVLIEIQPYFGISQKHFPR